MSPPRYLFVTKSKQGLTCRVSEKTLLQEPLNLSLRSVFFTHPVIEVKTSLIDLRSWYILYCQYISLDGPIEPKQLNPLSENNWQR